MRQRDFESTGKCMKVNILGVNVDDVTLDEATRQVDTWLKLGGKYYIVTPNPEFIVSAQKDPEFKNIINQANLSIPDGMGLKIFGKVKNRVTGVDLMLDLVKLASLKGFSVGFLGGRDSVAQKTADNLVKVYPNLKVSFAEEGGEVVTSSGDTASLSLRIIPSTDILFVAFGHGKQEKWIYQNLSNSPVKIAMGVGGAFDYISGSVPRAPKFLRTIGLEWLFRLIFQPWRIKRQLLILKFIWLILTTKN